MKILRMFLTCCVIAGLLNVANLFIYYFIHVNRIHDESNWDIESDGPTTDTWEYELSTLLICDGNSSNCPERVSHEVNNIKADNVSEPFEKSEFYYYVNDAALSNTRVCPKVPPGLGPVEMDPSIFELNALDDMFSFIKDGGYFRPLQCIPRQSVAIIIPMQYLHLAWKNYIGMFLYYIHPFLMRQLSEYQIFVIIQANTKEPFARGKLLNTGFLEAQKMRRNGWDCLIFHDVQYIPVDTRNLYSCTKKPRKLIATRRNPKTFGGIVAIRSSIFKKVNGFSNLNWKGDGDYVNMYQRLTSNNYTIETNPSPIGKYTTLKLFKNLNFTRPGHNSDTYHATTPIYGIDGLSSHSYRVVTAGMRNLFTFIEVDFNYQ